MAVNEALTRRVRDLLAGTPKVVEKRMFRGITFMVDGKMCVSVGVRLRSGALGTPWFTVAPRE
jgi:hypothetical protein